MPELVNTVTFKQGKATNINRLAFLLRAWAERSLTLEGATDKQTRKNINGWLNDFETIYKKEMLKIKENAGLFGYAIANREAVNIGAVNETSISIESFLQKYGLSLDATNSVDSTNIRNFRNSFGTRWKGNYKGFYKEWNDTINQPATQGLSFRALTNKVRDKAWYRDLVSIVDGSGRKWNPDSYSAMYSATQASTYQDDVHVDELKDLGIQFVQISDHNTDTPICSQYEGKVYALSANPLGVPVLEIRPPFHPNCRHVTLSARPELADEYKTINKEVDNTFQNKKKDFPKNWKRTVLKQETYNLKNRSPV
jgi:hypothetical protein